MDISSVLFDPELGCTAFTVERITCTRSREGTTSRSRTEQAMGCIHPGTPEGLKLLPEEEKQRLVADAQKSFDEALLKREALGISKTTNTSPEDEKASEDLAKKFFKDFVYTQCVVSNLVHLVLSKKF